MLCIMIMPPIQCASFINVSYFICVNRSHMNRLGLASKYTIFASLSPVSIYAMGMLDQRAKNANFTRYWSHVSSTISSYIIKFITHVTTPPPSLLLFSSLPTHPCRLTMSLLATLIPQPMPKLEHRIHSIKRHILLTLIHRLITPWQIKWQLA